MEGLTEKEIDLVCNIFRSGQHTMGKHVYEFEEKFASYFGVKNAVMVNSGSSANLLALESFARGTSSTHSSEGGKYIAIPAIMWPTSIWPIVQLGFRALVIDTMPNSLEIDMDLLFEACEEYGDKLVGAVLIHPLGKSLDLARIQQLKNDFNLFIIEDNCESIGSGNGNRYAGTVGDFGTFSFYFSHHMTTVEGGMVVTDDDQRADDLRSMRAHGWTRNRKDRELWENNFPELHQDFLFVTSGYNFRPMEFQGALGISQLSKLSSFIERRILIARQISKSINKSNLILVGAELTEYTKSKIPVHSWMALPLLVANENITAKYVFDYFERCDIQIRPLLAGDFLSQPAGKSNSISTYRKLTNSKKTYSKGFMIGNHHAMTDSQVSYLVDALQNFGI